MTGMPIGVVNVAIVDAATRGEQRFATGIGLGGALADTVHAALAFVGIGRVVASHPQAERALTIVAAVLITGYALASLRRRGQAEDAPPRRRASGLATGLLLTLPNPAALAAWVSVAAVLWPGITLVPALALAAGVGVGSAGWFVLLARWIAMLPRDGRAARYAPPVALVLLVTLAVVGVARAFA